MRYTLYQGVPYWLHFSSFICTGLPRKMGGLTLYARSEQHENTESRAMQKDH